MNQDENEEEADRGRVAARGDQQGVGTREVDPPQPSTDAALERSAVTLKEFALMQHNDGRRALSSLVRDCTRRFDAAANLVGLDGPIVKRIHDARYEGQVDLAPLYPIWEVICRRYRTERFDAQESLFKEHETDVLERWGQFLHWELFPHLLRENEFVRNVLRAVELLPCRSNQQAASALFHYLEEMSLPFGCPSWEATEIE